MKRVKNNMPEVTFANGPAAKPAAPNIKPTDGNAQPQAQMIALDMAELRILKKDGLRHTFSVTVRIPGTDAATAGNYLALFFIARRRYEIISCKERHEVAGSNGSPVTVQLNKVPNGTAPASCWVIGASPRISSIVRRTDVVVYCV